MTPAFADPAACHDPVLLFANRQDPPGIRADP